MLSSSWRLAQQVRTEPYDQNRFIQSLFEIRKLTRAEPNVFAPQAAELCRVSGVAFVFVPELPATRVPGATRWLISTRSGRWRAGFGRSHLTFHHSQDLCHLPILRLVPVSNREICPRREKKILING